MEGLPLIFVKPKSNWAANRLALVKSNHVCFDNFPVETCHPNSDLLFSNDIIVALK